MKRLIAVMAMVGMFAAPMWANAGEFKVGFVNRVKLLKEAPQAEEASKRLQKEFEPREKQLLATQKKVNEKEERFVKDSEILSPSERQKQERDILSDKREFKLAETELKEDFAIRQSEEMSKIQALLIDAIQQVGKDEQFDLIMYEGVSYASPRVDITDKVIERLKKK